MATRAKTSTSRNANSTAHNLVERVVERGRTAGHTYLDTVEEAVNRAAELQESIGEASQIEFISTVTSAQADVTRGVVGAYVSAGRTLIR